MDFRYCNMQETLYHGKVLGLIEYFAVVLPILCIEHLLKRCVLIYNFTMSDVVNTKKNVTFALMTKR